ncbi:hypothetical protein TWF718_010686 [Orbilia javanica]|uniref:Uncharacterized protein n=1 Tax=Orbilia javanica TaxID=47235 RepID=A0AAN8MIJ2_9PEZI
MATLFGWILLLSSLPLSTALQWDDFTNNLATDLAPLIALFGEQVTKQFLSESLSTWDNVIFAMAPLGILTAVVSAIRVCGNSSLRAFIGRAQESPGAAEIELLSCTSDTTSELWHEGGIARVFGSPQILEVVKSETQDEDYKGPDCTAGIRLFSGAYNKGDWDYVKGAHQDLEKSQYHRPNLSLNVGIKRQPKIFTYVAAALGIILQTGVLVYAGLTAYVFPERFLTENGRPSEIYAFPFTLAGTILLCVGMFLCAFIIEQSTHEAHFKKMGKSKMYWVQPGGQKIGDQVFGSYIGYSNDSKYIISRPGDRNRFNRILWITVASTMLGFVVQFVGLRAMHYSVIMAQLGATLVMAIIRASLRAQREAEARYSMGMDSRDVDYCRDIVQGHELDFLAMKLEDVGGLVLSRQQTGRLSETESENLPTSSGIKSLIARARLARLTNGDQGPSWEGLRIREIVSQLQAAISGVMGLLSARLKGNTSKVNRLYWSIKIFDMSGDRAFYFRIWKEGLVWKSDDSELEAIVGVWAWSFLRTDRRSIGRLGQPNFRLITIAPDVNVGESEGRASFMGPVDEAKTWYQAWIQRGLVLEQGAFGQISPGTLFWAGRTGYRRPLFGFQVSQESGDRIPLFVTTQNSNLTMCAQDVFIAFLVAVLREVDDIGGMTTVRSSNGEDTFLLENSRVEEMANCFEDSGLGSREDAYMCMVPLLIRERKLPKMDETFATVRRNVKLLIKDGKFTEAEELLLQWIDSNSSIAETEKLYLEIAELYRKAMRHRNGGIQAFGFDGVCKLLDRVSKGNRDPATSKLVYQYGWIGLRIAMEIKDDEILERLKQHGATEDEVADYPDDSIDICGWAQKNDATVMRYLVGGRDYIVDWRRSDGRTALSWAAGCGNSDIVALLLEEGVDHNSVDAEGRTPLSFAAQNGHHSIVRMLLHEDTASLNVGLQGTPLILAAEGGHEECVRILLGEPDIKIYDDSGCTALDLAIENDFPGIAELLIEKKAYSDDDILFEWTERGGYHRVVDLVMEKIWKDSDIWRNPRLMLRMANKYSLVMSSLIKKGKIDLRKDGWYLLKQAVDRDRQKVAGVLLKEGAVYDGLLTQAINEGKLWVFELIAETRAGFTAYRATEAEEALANAVTRGYKRTAELLIKGGAPFNRMALLGIARVGDLEMLEMLIENSVNFELGDEATAALQEAALAGHGEVVELLIKRGVSLGCSLEHAAEGGHLEVAKRLLDAGADVNQGGGAALVAAAKYNQLAMVEFLVQHGADVNVRDREVFKIAIFRGAEMEQILSQGASPPQTLA